MNAPTIDLNADLGEGFGAWAMGDDAALLDVVTSASVACGFHAGDPAIMRRVCGEAAKRKVAVGAHVGYPDVRGFGRRDLRCHPDEVTGDVLYQIGALQAIARAAGSAVEYVKPHGALYNAAMVDEALAGAVARGCAEASADLAVVGLPGSTMEGAAATWGLRFIAEGFADRAYTAAGTLVPRSQPGAVLHDVETIAGRVVRLAVRGEVEAIDGSVLTLPLQTVCVHGDTPGAVEIAVAVRAALGRAGVHVASWAAPHG